MNILPHFDLTGRLDSNVQVVAGDHFNPDACCLEVGNGF